MKETKRELVEQLLELPTRIQLGKLVQINGIQLFQVVYELDNTTTTTPTASLEADDLYPAISIDDLDTLKESTGLTARLITLVHTMENTSEEVNTDLDEYGCTSYIYALTEAEVNFNYQYTIY